MLATVLMTSCREQWGCDQEPTKEESYHGEMIQFASGTTVPGEVTRATLADTTYTITPGKTYYMPDTYRFVCRMFYIAANGSTKFDVDGGTDVITWLKVRGNMGNSLYWLNSYRDLDWSNPELFDTYGNDKEAICLYWQNRKEHAFLAWTDLNRAASMIYDPTPGSGTLKFKPEDITYVKHTGIKQTQWVDNGFEVHCKGETRIFDSWAELRTFMETGDNYRNYIPTTGPTGVDFTDQEYYYAYGWSCKYRLQRNAAPEYVDPLHQKYGWYEYQMFYDKLKYTGPRSGPDIERREGEEDEPAYLYNRATNKYLAEIVYQCDTTYDEEGEIERIVCDSVYYQTDEYGNVRYDETKPRYTFYYKLLQEKKETETITNIPANVFDLTRGVRTSINQQPDIAQALTKQAPLGATQSANRVNLYFKHQFSQVQVNVKSSADLSVVINEKHIQKVELLGVTEKGYVFTTIDEDGNLEPATYESVDVSKYTDEELKHNPYGTAFNMFKMAEPAAGYIKSFNAITFGQLQAIRITWNENENGTGISHESTYHVADEFLKNLRSGHKYIWNIELRRGTLAIVRTEIVDWIVPQNELEYTTNGTIQN